MLGGVLIGLAAVRGLPQWQSIPSTWDAVWHANTIRFILDTGQASPTHMGELRNVETHDALYYPSTFHALASVLSQLTGAAPTTAYTLSSVAAAVWLFPVERRDPDLAPAADTHRRVAHGRGCRHRGGAVRLLHRGPLRRVRHRVDAQPRRLRHGRADVGADRVHAATPRPHPAGGAGAARGVLRAHHRRRGHRPVRRGVVAGRRAVAARSAGAARRSVSLCCSSACPPVLLLLPQFVGVLRQAEIIVGHTFVTHEGKKRALIDAVVQHTRHLNDFPIQWGLIVLAAVGAVILLVRRIWWPLAVWLLLVVSIVYSSAPFGGPLGAMIGKFSDLFYSDPRRLSAVVTLLLAPTAGIAVFTLVAGGGRPRRANRLRAHPTRPAIWHGLTAAALVAVSVVAAWHYFPRHKFLFGEKYDSVIVDAKDLEAFAYLATLPGARDTLIGNANTDGTAWMYAVAGLHPLWTHYDYPVQQGPGYHRFIFWAYADDADTDPRIAEAVRALNIRYVLTSTPVVLKFAMPDGLVSLDKSRSWEKIYDNGGARIYEWRGSPEGMQKE